MDLVGHRSSDKRRDGPIRPTVALPKPRVAILHQRPSGQRSSPQPGESRGGVSPPRAPRTVRDTLASYGSRCSAIPMQKAPMRKQMRVGADDPRQPVSCTFGPLMQSLELVARPADQEGIDPMQSRGQLRLVEVAVVVDPALDIRSVHPGQILQGFIGPMMERPPSDRLPDCFQRVRTGRRQKGRALATTAPGCLSRSKGITEEVKRLDRIVATPVRVLAIDELRLCGMKNQPAGPEADLQGTPKRAGLLFASAVADDVVRVPLERDGGKAPHQPQIKSIVQKQISQDRADHPTLRRSCRTRDDTTILHLDRSPQPALDVEKHPRAVRMMTNRLEQQLPLDAVELALDVDIEHPVKPPAALTGLPEGIDRRAAGAVPIGVLVEAGLQDRLQVLFDDFLGNSVANRWDAQRPGPSIALEGQPAAPVEESSSLRTCDSRAGRGCW